MGLGTQSPGSGVVIRGSVGESEGLVPWVLEAGTLRHVFLASQVSGLLRGWGLGKWDVWSSREQGQGGAPPGLFQMLDVAADGLLAGLVSILDPPDTWVPSHMDLRPGE